MAESKPFPDEIPPMGAEFEKPYMEFEYDGEIYRLEELRGGHNGSGAARACKSQGAKWDESKQRWVVAVENNMIEIDLSDQPEASRSIGKRHNFLKRTHISNNPRRSKTSTGYLLPAGTKESGPRYPVDCEFYMFLRVRVPGKPDLMNPIPFKLEAKGLDEWPPKEGTAYKHEDNIELYPEWLPFGKILMRPVATIPSGDETVLTRVFTVQEPSRQKSKLLSRLVNWLT